MSFLNLMGNKLKPKEVNEVLEELTNAIAQLNNIVSSLQTPSASSVTYDNTSSGLTADDVQSAIDEVYESIPTPTGGGKIKTVTWDGNGSTPNVRALPDDVGIILDIEQNGTGDGYTVAPFALKASGKYTIVNRSNNTITAVGYSYTNGSISLGTGVVDVDAVFNRGTYTYTMYYLPIETE